MRQIIPYFAALSLGLASTLYAADPAKAEEAIKYANEKCIELTGNHIRCIRTVIIRDEKHPDGLLELTARADKINEKASLILGRVAYNPRTGNYFILQFTDGNSVKGVSANGKLENDGIDEVLVTASKNKDGHHDTLGVDLNSQNARKIHQEIFDESLEQFIAKAKEPR